MTRKTPVEDAGNRGSITVEASIIVPVVILSIAAVIYMGLLLYQRAVIQSAAVTAAADGAVVWSSGIGEIGTGGISGGSFEKIKLYRRIYDSDGDACLEKIEEYAASLAGKGELLKPADTTIHAEVQDYAVCRKMVVGITKSYEVPLGRFLRLFGGSGSVTISAKGSSMLDEPVELIRNTDFMIDLEKELEKNNPELKNLGDKARGAMNRIKSRMDQFLE